MSTVNVLPSPSALLTPRVIRKQSVALRNFIEGDRFFPATRRLGANGLNAIQDAHV
jgi:hypothetical protein